MVQGQKAPSAKRCIKTELVGRRGVAFPRVRKHRAPKGALRRGRSFPGSCVSARQKAPRAKRCIKTSFAEDAGRNLSMLVRKHRAPKSALRLCGDAMRGGPNAVRKHRAPKGALRLTLCPGLVIADIRGQKAPSAKRCIKTRGCWVGRRRTPWSESTERQKVH